MGRTLTDDRKILKDWAIILAGLNVTQKDVGKFLNVNQCEISRWLKGVEIQHNVPIILHNSDGIIHNSGIVMQNFRDGLPPNPKPQLFVGRAENLKFLENESVDIIITSPPYNLGQEKWPMGGNGRTPRDAGIGYSEFEDAMTEPEYQSWQVKCLIEFYRVAKTGASLFYNHKVRQREGEVIHPMEWIKGKSDWLLRQEIIWDRLSTHNHSSTLFWPQDERIYWLTKGKPNLQEKSIGLPSVWREFGPIAKPAGGHPAPFTPALPKMVLQAVGKPGDVVLDPFGGSMTTCLIASSMGYKSIGVDLAEDYVKKAAELLGVDYGR